MTSSLARRIVAGVVGACGWLLAISLPTPAWASPPSATARLCGGSMACSIQTDRPQYYTYPINLLVTGNPGTTIEIRGYLVRFTDQFTFDHLEPCTDPVTVALGPQGVTSATLSYNVKSLTPGSPWVFFGPTDVDPHHFDATVGTFVPLASLYPLTLGDGWGDKKPVGQPISLKVIGAYSYSAYAVEYRDDAGQWQRVNDPEDFRTIYARPHGENPDEVFTITYRVPRGLAPRPYTFRLFSSLLGISGTAIHTWTVIPSDKPQPKPYLPTWTPPVTLGGGHLSSPGRDSVRVATNARTVSVVAGAVGVGLVSVATIRRRPLREKRARR